MAYLDPILVKKLAGRLQLLCHEDKSKGTRSCVVGSGQMRKDSVRFVLFEYKDRLECSLAIWGNQKRKEKIIQAISDEIPCAVLSPVSGKAVIIDEKEYVFEVYVWTSPT